MCSPLDPFKIRLFTESLQMIDPDDDKKPIKYLRDQFMFIYNNGETEEENIMRALCIPRRVKKSG